MGTAAGAAGALGTAIVIDALLLEAEDALNRDDFRREIVGAIRETRRELNIGRRTRSATTRDRASHTGREPPSPRC